MSAACTSHLHLLGRLRHAAGELAGAKDFASDSFCSSSVSNHQQQPTVCQSTACLDIGRKGSPNASSHRWRDLACVSYAAGQQSSNSGELPASRPQKSVSGASAKMSSLEELVQDEIELSHTEARAGLAARRALEHSRAEAVALHSQLTEAVAETQTLRWELSRLQAKLRKQEEETGAAQRRAHAERERADSAEREMVNLQDELEETRRALARWRVGGASWEAVEGLQQELDGLQNERTVWRREREKLEQARTLQISIGKNAANQEELRADHEFWMRRSGAAGGRQRISAWSAECHEGYKNGKLYARCVSSDTCRPGLSITAPA